MKSWQEITPVGNRIMPKGQKAYRRGEAPVYEKYQIHSPNGAAEIMEIIINFFHPFGAKFVLFFYSGGFTPLDIVLCCSA